MERCPRCGEPLPADAYLGRMKQASGREPAYRLRHKRASGRRCVAYVGPAYLLVLPPREESGASVFAAADALGRRAG